jgi:hypothetical protein
MQKNAIPGKGDISAYTSFKGGHVFLKPER